MALNELRNWLIAYDIAHPRRLRRVHRFLLSEAVPVQFSLFAARATPMKAGILRAGLAALVNEREDDVRFYPVPEPADLVIFGRKPLPDGLRLVESASALTLAPFALNSTHSRDSMTKVAIVAAREG
jgi:CRISPR-associated protein Cas2